MESLIYLLDNYGVYGLLSIVGVYILLNSRVSIHYPKNSGSDKKA